MEALPVGRWAHPTAPEGGRGPREGGFRLCAADGDVGVPGGGKWKKDEGRKRLRRSSCALRDYGVMKWRETGGEVEESNHGCSPELGSCLMMRS